MAGGYSYNGWPANSDPAAIGVVKSQWFPGGVVAGDVLTVFRYLAEQFNARVEEIVGGYCWGFTYKQNVNNPSSLSCHASGTAIDVNAPFHSNGTPASASFTDEQIGTIYAILDELSGAVSWLDDYDPMHFEIQVDAADLAFVADSLPAGGGPPPDNSDWFDMASEDDLRRIVGEEIDNRLASIGVAVWTTGINERGAANAMLNQASAMAQAAADALSVIGVTVWTTPITDETANVLLARAAAE